MQELSELDFAEKVEQAERPVLVDFSARWCPPCKMLKPVIERSPWNSRASWMSLAWTPIRTST